MSVRHPAVAGLFYPKEANALNHLLNEVINVEGPKINNEICPNEIIGGIVPHAGYKYSAYEAIHFFHCLKNSAQKFDTFLIINPCHYGSSEDISMDSHHIWSTPLGPIALDLELMDFMNLPRSAMAQQSEHAAEVILPYLQFFLDYEFKIIPISMSKQSYKDSRKLAEMIYKANQVVKKNIALIASSDFSHQVRPEVGFYNDNLVINRIINNSIRGLYDTILENNITVCGYGPIMTLMFYARMVNPGYNVEILARGNSAKCAKSELVVDYVSALFYC